MLFFCSQQSMLNWIALAACPFCDQTEENIQHILLTSLRAPESTSRIYGWWCHTLRSVPKVMRKGLNSLVIFAVWELWKHRNACTLLYNVAEEGSSWCMAGATAFQGFLIRSLSPDL
ncbi:hypothetical protein BDA96_01G560700 [Sorghum bicolor]|uniref:Uncharacterized protein n=1 Tax=Sorghum bicolor TaxID=4558 RepID=A0A921S7Y3_SORBI|nr:hypothetical protein BDA96_01G560700 [Sorghum bicolor]